MRILKLFLSVLLFFIVQMAVVSKIDISTYSGNMAIVLIAMQAMGLLTNYRAPYAGALYGFFADVFLNTTFGISLLLLFLVGIIAERLYNYLNSDSFISLIIIIALVTPLHNFIFGLVYKILGRDFTLNYILQRTFSIEIIFNCILALVFLYISHRVNSRRILRNGIDD